MRRPVVLYDGECGICRVCVWVFALIDRSGRVARLDFNRSEADALLAPLARDRRRCAVHLALPGGSVISAGPALRMALRIAIGPGLASRLIAAQSLAAFIDAGYRGVAAIRPRLGWLAGLGRRMPPDDYP